MLPWQSCCQKRLYGSSSGVSFVDGPAGCVVGKVWGMVTRHPTSRNPSYNGGKLESLEGSAVSSVCVDGGEDDMSRKFGPEI